MRHDTLPLDPLLNDAWKKCRTFRSLIVHVLSAIFEVSYRHMRAVSGPGRKA